MEPENIFEIFFSLENPAFYAFIFIVIVLMLVFLMKREFINPLNVRKKKLELENAKLAALYSEVDPDPIIRIDNSWKVIDMNNSALAIIGDNNELMNKVLNDLKENFKNHKNVTLKLNDKFFSSKIKEISDLEFKHIYLHDVTKRIEYEQKIKNYQENLKNLRTKVEKANEVEKQRIGQELHDGVGHSISLIKIELQNLVERKKLDKNEKSIHDIFSNIDDLAVEVRNLSHELKPPILAEFGLLHAVQSLVDRTNGKKNIQGYVTYNNEFKIDYNEIELNIYRICQEALNNIEKHSRCTEFNIDFYLKQNILLVSISDNGDGFNLADDFYKKEASLGLLNMKERAESIGGNFDIDSIINMGTTITMEFKVCE